MTKSTLAQVTGHWLGLEVGKTSLWSALDLQNLSVTPRKFFYSCQTRLTSCTLSSGIQRKPELHPGCWDFPTFSSSALVKMTEDIAL